MFVCGVGVVERRLLAKGQLGEYIDFFKLQFVQSMGMAGRLSIVEN